MKKFLMLILLTVWIVIVSTVTHIQYSPVPEHQHMAAHECFRAAKDEGIDASKFAHVFTKKDNSGLTVKLADSVDASGGYVVCMPDGDGKMKFLLGSATGF